MAPKPVAQWSVDDVCTWLSAIGLGSKSEPFKENGVDGSLLETLGAGDLTADLGLSNIQAKKVIHELEFASSLSSGGGGDYDEEYVQSLQNKIDELEKEVAALKAAAATPEPVVEAVPEPEPQPKAAPAPAPAHRNEHHVAKGAAGGAAKGAVGGAVIGAIAGDPAAGAKAGAAGGATVGAMNGAGRRRRARMAAR